MTSLNAWGWQVRRGDLVFDPFSGTGSLLVAAASFGARTLGADIDVRVLRDGKADKAGKVTHACLACLGCPTAEALPRACLSSVITTVAFPLPSCAGARQ